MNEPIDRWRRAAKILKKSYGLEDKAALERVRAVLGDKTGLKHADFLHVIAREQGHESWPKFKLGV